MSAFALREAVRQLHEASAEAPRLREAYEKAAAEWFDSLSEFEQHKYVLFVNSFCLKVTGLCLPFGTLYFSPAVLSAVSVMSEAAFRLEHASRKTLSHQVDYAKAVLSWFKLNTVEERRNYVCLTHWFYYRSTGKCLPSGDFAFSPELLAAVFPPQAAAAEALPEHPVMPPNVPYHLFSMSRFPFGL